jgi:hypothetical protein
VERVVVTRGALIATLLAGCDPTSFRDCEISCTAETGCPDGFSCGAEGLCRSAGETRSCSELPPDGAPPGAVTLRETANETVAPGMSIGCGDPTTLVTRDNTWFRAFSLADFSITKPFHIDGVAFAVESSSQAVSLAVSVGTYTGTAFDDTLDMTTFTELASGSAAVPTTLSPHQYSVALSADVPAHGTFVVQIAAPDLNASSGKFRIGSTVGAETHPGYIQSTACGISTPETTALAGKPNAHLIISVTGTD